MRLDRGEKITVGGLTFLTVAIIFLVIFMALKDCREANRCREVGGEMIDDGPPEYQTVCNKIGNTQICNTSPYQPKKCSKELP